MDCPNCHTWNPDDKLVCWRCQTELPRPVEKKKRTPVTFLGLPAWTWVVLLAMFAIYILLTVVGPQIVGR